MKKSKTKSMPPDCWEERAVCRSFNTFTPLDSNRSAFSKAETAAKFPGDRASNPLLLCSEVNGLGATHLMEAIVALSGLYQKPISMEWGLNSLDGSNCNRRVKDRPPS
jgi:chromosomal replication initiation ATPase DnaA